MKKKELSTTGIADALSALLQQVSEEAADQNQLAKCNASLKALIGAVSALCKKQDETRDRVEETRDGLAAYNNIIQQIHSTQKRYAVWNAVAQERLACAQVCDQHAKWLTRVVDRDGAGAAAECGYKIRSRSNV